MIMSNILILLFIGSVLGSTSLITTASKNGFLNGALTRSVAGGSLSFASSTFLVGYTNLDSYLSACANGSLGFSGYVFIGGLAALIITWVSNLIEYKVAVQ